MAFEIKFVVKPWNDKIVFGCAVHSVTKCLKSSVSPTILKSLEVSNPECLFLTFVSLFNTAVRHFLTDNGL